jgi:hypothetical protein
MRKLLPLLSGVIVGILYGLVCQAGMRFNNEVVKNLYGVMSFGYVFLMPLAMGVTTVWAAPSEARRNIWYCLFMPWLTTILALLFSLAVGWEGAICFVMAGVIFVPLSTVGGLLAYLAFNVNKNRTLTPVMLSLMVASPPLSAVVEAQMDLPQQMYTVATSIPIAAPTATVWHNIIRVPAIHEPITGTFYKMGFPRPIEATLSHEGIGGVRHAIFDKHLEFIETITDWEDQRKLSFAIKSDPSSIPTTTLDAHVTVGGRYFDVLQGTYEIEPIDATHSILHLSSHFRVSTRFNFYASLWARFLMKDIQESILTVIRERCQSGFEPLQQNGVSFL